MKVLTLMLAVLAGCTKAPAGAAAPETTAPAPPPAAATSGPRVTFPDGFVVSVEIAADDDMRAQGLMFRDHLLPGTGMLFLFAQEGQYPFWMKNTRIPLDMVWIDSGRKVSAVKYNVPPCVTEDCPSYDPGARARYVLEVAGGVAQRHGIKAGDILKFEGTDNIVVH